MQSMNLSSFAVPLANGSSCELLRERWNDVLNSSGLGEKIYQKALFWMRTQQDFYRRIQSDILAQTEIISSESTLNAV